MIEVGAKSGLGDIIRIYAAKRNAYPNEAIRFFLTKFKDFTNGYDHKKHLNEILFLCDDKNVEIQTTSKKGVKVGRIPSNSQHYKARTINPSNIKSDIELPEKFVVLSFEFSRKHKELRPMDSVRYFDQDFESKTIELFNKAGYEVWSPTEDTGIHDFLYACQKAQFCLSVDSFFGILLCFMPEEWKRKSCVAYSKPESFWEGKEFEHVYYGIEGTIPFYLNSGVEPLFDSTPEKIFELASIID